MIHTSLCTNFWNSKASLTLRSVTSFLNVDFTLVKKIQQDQQSKLQQLEKKKQEELLREKLDRELEDNPNLFLMDAKFMEAMEK